MPGRPTFDLQSHSRSSDGALRAREVVARPPRRRGRAARADRPRHRRRRRRGGAPRAREHGLALSPAAELSARRTATTRTCTSSATSSTPPTPRCATRSRTSAPTARGAIERDGRPRCASSASRSTTPAGRARREAGSRSGRPHLADAVLAHPGQRRAARARGDRTARTSCSRPTSCRARRPTSRARGRPSPRRSRSSTPPAASRCGRTRSGTSTTPEEVRARSTASRAEGLDGVECFYATHTREQARLLHDHCERARAAHAPARPTSTAPSTSASPLPRLRALRPRAGARADRGLGRASSRSSR